jgi:methylamine dehydrogenase light chain
MTSHFDRLGEKLLRGLARRTSRRNLLTRLGAVLAGAAAVPLLPVSRALADASSASVTAFSRKAQTTEDTTCNYWRYCAIDGSLCTCCGGGLHTCPPGSVPSPTSWIGTCLNPDDQRSYLIGYRDCCGKGMCGRCMCNSNDRETPLYRVVTNNDIIWCFGAPTMVYHCSTAVLIGLAS